MLSMASKDEPTQCEGLQNSSKPYINRVIPSVPPDADNTKDLQFQRCYDEIYIPFALPLWNPCSTELFLRKVASLLPSTAAYRFLLYRFQNKGYPLSEYYWKEDNNEFVIRTRGEYEEHVAQLFDTSFHNHQSFLEQNWLIGIIKHSTTEFPFVPFHHVPLSAVKTASPNQLHVYGARGGRAVLTGFCKGPYTRIYALTVEHLIDKVGEKLYAGEELLGCCCFKSKIMQIADQTYTSDLALIAIDPKSRYARDKPTAIEIEGQRYWPKLCSEEKINGIKAGDEVWIVDQFESLKTGKVFRHWYNNADEKLHNIMQINTTDGKALTIDGDSGCCVCLPPKPNSDVIEVIGMVIGISEFPDKTTCTNAVLLPIILKHALRDLPPDLKKVGDLCEDAGLPVNVDFSVDSDFYIGEKSENLTVESVKSIGSIVMESHDSGVGLSGILHG